MITATYLLDTNICIYIAKKHPAAVMKRFEQLQQGEVVMSFITLGELMYGAEKSQRRDASMRNLNRLIELIPVIWPDPAATTCYGEIRSRLERAGTPIGANDLWIATHALSANLVLVSNNTREFERVPGLRLENWVG